MTTIYALAHSLTFVIAAAQGPTWVHQFGTDSAEGALAVCQDDSGGSYVGGFTYGTWTGQSFGSSDAWLSRFDGTGARIWVRQFGTLAPDGAGGVYAAGYTAGDFAGPSAGSYDIWVSRLDSTGQVLWSRQIGTPEAEGVASAVADGRGGVFLAGSTGGDLAAPNSGYSDAWLARFAGP